MPKSITVIIYLLAVLLICLQYSCDPIEKNNDMSINEKTEAGLKKSIEKLIAPDDDYGIEDLDAIYHKDMIVILIDHLDNKKLFRKDEFMSMIAKKVEEKDEEDNTWVQFHHIDVTDDKGLIIMKRKVNLTGKKSQLHASIDFVWEDNRWQIIRENILSQPLY